MRGRVLVLRLVATPDVTAFLAHPEVHPRVAHLEALVAAGGIARRHRFDVIEVRAGVRHDRTEFTAPATNRRQLPGLYPVS